MLYALSTPAAFEIDFKIDSAIASAVEFVAISVPMLPYFLINSSAEPHLENTVGVFDIQPSAKALENPS